VSAKVKTQMLGNNDITLDLNNQLAGKGWTNYAEGPAKNGVVVFFDGFQCAPWHWGWEGRKLRLGGGRGGTCPRRQERTRERELGEYAVGAAACDEQAASSTDWSVTKK
jgi:hypothetical protein